MLQVAGVIWTIAIVFTCITATAMCQKVPLIAVTLTRAGGSSYMTWPPSSSLNPGIEIPPSDTSQKSRKDAGNQSMLLVFVFKRIVDRQHLPWRATQAAAAAAWLLLLQVENLGAALGVGQRSDWHSPLKLERYAKAASLLCRTKQTHRRTAVQLGNWIVA
jgi:hypothetical protein